MMPCRLLVMSFWRSAPLPLYRLFKRTLKDPNLVLRAFPGFPGNRMTVSHPPKGNPTNHVNCVRTLLRWLTMMDRLVRIVLCTACFPPKKDWIFIHKIPSSSFSYFTAFTFDPFHAHLYSYVLSPTWTISSYFSKPKLVSSSPASDRPPQLLYS